MLQNYAERIGLLIFFSLAMTTYYVLSTKKKRPRSQDPQRKIINDVLMFSEITQSQLVRSKFSGSLIHPSADRLLNFLNLSRSTLDICMYIITSQEIANLIHMLHNRGVRIRIIVDAEMAYATGSAIKRLHTQGIEMRCMKSTHLMHNKFCLIDASNADADIGNNRRIKPLAMIGSLNWTSQAITFNWENVLVTSQTTIVESLRIEFEKLWSQFKPIDS